MRMFDGCEKTQSFKENSKAHDFVGVPFRELTTVIDVNATACSRAHNSGDSKRS